MTEREIYERAKRKVKKKKEFYSHVGVYLAVVIFLFTINFMTGPDFWWAVFPTLGWGIGIVGHYFSVFGLPTSDGEDWEEQEIEKEIGKIKRSKNIKNHEDNITLPDEELELKEFKKLRDEWNDKDFV